MPEKNTRIHKFEKIQNTRAKHPKETESNPNTPNPQNRSFNEKDSKDGSRETMQRKCEEPSYGGRKCRASGHRKARFPPWTPWTSPCSLRLLLLLGTHEHRRTFVGWRCDGALCEETDQRATLLNGGWRKEDLWWREGDEMREGQVSLLRF